MSGQQVSVGELWLNTAVIQQVDTITGHLHCEMINRQTASSHLSVRGQRSEAGVSQVRLKQVGQTG